MKLRKILVLAVCCVVGSVNTALGGQITPPPGLLHWWKCEGNTLDSHGSLDGTPLGNPGYQAGHEGAAIVFDGMDDQVIIPFGSTLDFSPGSEFTISAWVNPGRVWGPPNGFQALVVKGPASGHWDWGLYLDPQNRFYAGCQVPGGVVSATVASPGSWYLVTVTYSANQWRLFVNGVFENASQGPAITQSGGALTFAHKGEDTVVHDYYLGKLDEVMIFNRALTSGEIRDMYDEVCPCPPPGLIVIDFENIPAMPHQQVLSPIPGSAQLSDRFLTTHGVRFSSSSNFVPVVFLGAGHATSGVNGIGCSTADGRLSYARENPIFITFFEHDNPNTPAITDFVSVRGDLAGYPSQQMTLNAYDDRGRLVDSMTRTDEGGTVLSVSGHGIHSVEFIGTLDYGGVAIDDVSFHPVTSIPVPVEERTWGFIKSRFQE